jgi:hypothetical protein
VGKEIHCEHERALRYYESKEEFEITHTNLEGNAQRERHRDRNQYVYQRCGMHISEQGKSQDEERSIGNSMSMNIHHRNEGQDGEDEPLGHLSMINAQL